MRGINLLMCTGAAWLAACSPSWNWRTVRLDGAPLAIELPCKPDQAAQTVTLGGAAVLLSMTGCENAGATFAVSRVLLAPGASPGPALAQWRTATLAGMRARSVREVPFLPPGGLALPGSVRVQALGQSREGRAVHAQAVWFARATPQGVWLFHAVIYADAIAPEVADTFFGGLRLQEAS